MTAGHPPRRILIAAAGSHGDVLPFVGLGRALQARGHDVRLFASEPFAAVAADAGLPFVAVMSTADYQRYLADRDATDPRRGMVLLAEAVLRTQRRALALLEREHEPGRTLLVGSSLAWATRLLAETTGSPVATVHLSPSWFRSNHRAPSIGPLGHLERAPTFVKRLLWHAMDRRFLDPLFAAPFNALRAERGLPPVRRLFHAWIHQADRTLGLFPAWFAPPQPDWPAHATLTGFPLDDAGDAPPLPPALAGFLDAGEPPVAFTTGTANASSREVFEAAVAACRIAGRRGLLLTQDASQVPADLPPDVRHVPWAPFRSLLPRVAALVHHGGIGTTAEALRAGLPQVVRPMGFDQFDNALRVAALGVGRTLPHRRPDPVALAAAVRGVVDDPAVRSRAASIATTLAGAPSGLSAAAEALDALACGRGR